MSKKIAAIVMALTLAASLTACGSSLTGKTQTASSASSSTVTSVSLPEESSESSTVSGSLSITAETTSQEPIASLGEEETSQEEMSVSSAASAQEEVVAVANMVSGGVIDTTDLFSNRDLRQTADLSEATSLTVSDGQTLTINTEGVYVISGTAENATIVVEAGDEDKVQLVLDGLTVTNEDFPVIYVKNADKVFITTTQGSENTLSVTGSFTADGDTNTDAVIFSRDDLVLNGLGTLNISSSDNGIACKDDLKVTGGTVNISCVADGIEVNDSFSMADGTVNIATYKDGIHAENDEDATQGTVYVCGGSLNISAGDDAVHGTSYVQIDGGALNLSAAEGIEGTYIQVNGGDVNIEASDDGINAAWKSNASTPTVEINDGTLTIVMGQGDTDGIDSNGNLIINGGTIDVTGQSPFDYDGQAQYNGGTLIVNGSQTDSITNQMMGGGMGGFGGGRGGR